MTKQLKTENTHGGVVGAICVASQHTDVYIWLVLNNETGVQLYLLYAQSLFIYKKDLCIAISAIFMRDN